MKPTKADGTPIARLWPVEGPNKVVKVDEFTYGIDVWEDGDWNPVMLKLYLTQVSAQAECDRLNLQWRADRMKRIAVEIMKRSWLYKIEALGVRDYDNQEKCWAKAHSLLSGAAIIEAQLYTQRYNLTNTNNETE